MELGNAFFGNSRGQYEVSRDSQYEGPLYTLLEECTGNSRGEGGFENETFKVFPYYWGECTCGFDEKCEGWGENNSHDESCISVEINTQWANHVFDKGYEWLVPIYKKHGLKTTGESWWHGYGIKCTCGYEKKWSDFLSRNDHAPDCPIVTPNFTYKPTGYQIQWYKYPLRDAYANQKITALEFLRIVFRCLESLGDK